MRNYTIMMPLDVICLSLHFYLVCAKWAPFLQRKKPLDHNVSFSVFCFWLISHHLL